MPTGYTAGIEDGTITTGKDFLKLCTRAFGVAVELMDEPLSVPTPTKFEPDTYYKKRLEDERAELEKVKQMSFDEAKLQMRKSYENRLASNKKIAETYIKQNERYSKVRAEVEAWIPPTDEHKGLKKFALEQIDMCVMDQKYIDSYLTLAEEKFDDSDDAVKKYIDEQIDFQCQNVKRARESWDEEVKRANDKTLWMEQFLKSL